MTVFDISSYLDRIGVSDIPATAKGLALLQTAQIRRIPFENIDPLLGIEPDVFRGAIIAKILAEGRGGYCFELNLLLFAALEAVGFQARRRLARVRMGSNQGGPRTHLAMVCNIGGRDFLADAGFGGPAPLDPLIVDDDKEQKASNGRYILRTDTATGERVLSKRGPGGDFSLYGFDDAHVVDADIVAANYLCSTWSGSPFPNHLMVNGYDGDTRIGLFDRQMTLETEGRLERRDLGSVQDLEEAICGRLGLHIDQAKLEMVWSRIGQPDQDEPDRPAVPGRP